MEMDPKIIKARIVNADSHIEFARKDLLIAIEQILSDEKIFHTFKPEANILIKDAADEIIKIKSCNKNVVILEDGFDMDLGDLSVDELSTIVSHLDMELL